MFLKTQINNIQKLDVVSTHKLIIVYACHNDRNCLRTSQMASLVCLFWMCIQTRYGHIQRGRFSTGQ